jgi:hypothetical protein
MISGLALQYFRFCLEPKAPLHMPACLRATHRQAYNKGNVIHGGFGSTFRRIVCDRIGNRQEAITAGIRQEATGNS